MPTLTRRDALAASLAAGAALLSPTTGSTADQPTTRFRYCLNTSTIRGQKLSLPDEIDLAASAGYDAIEPWVNEIDRFRDAGGDLRDLRKRCDDKGLAVADAIGFPEWIVDAAARRQKGLDEAKRCMDLVRQLGCTHLAAPPVGATDQTNLSLYAAADRYHALAELGRSFGVTPLVELWGFSKSLSRLGEVVLVAVESKVPGAAILPDVYHLFKGGSDFAGLALVRGEAMGIFHVNDYPAKIERAAIKDADRVYPGDGVAPLGEVFRTLRAIGYNGYLSLELFNPEYWKQDAALVARTGLEKLKAAAR